MVRHDKYKDLFQQAIDGEIDKRDRAELASSPRFMDLSRQAVNPVE